jgi:hypothetical protein
MDLFSGTIADAQKDVAADITQLGAVLAAAIQKILDGYTIEIKAVKK